ncbi:caudovirales tail fiber assembly family protein [Enterobacter hormaechei]|uniref:tail fiber assembly protein n=1 Tax=Enterobacter hormaechei TaxID=158836 RepID=UPI0005EEBAF7|nr:tail fiber assembly protein [Enterobacter hormaechei]KJO81851.1 phage tail protein [Enterobacter hormaechei subsp. xiangfangensis]KJP25993.1 phage tail protein [Enterobacter hormaechei subsp. xiangfangensis]RCG79265.1 caudovirales tail fiber assembly family protein [Enterobacter hormaechei]RCG83754.1 caudovirales tail fiber assembly family protein [Enterobacter hormaechei]
MNYWYSPKNNAFYPVALKKSYESAGSLPDDLAEVTDEIFNEFSGTPPDGKVRVAGHDSLPCWQDKPVIQPTAEEIQAEARKLRDSFIESTDKMIVPDFTISDVKLRDEQLDELYGVRSAFKRWPTSEGWPDVELPEIPQWILIEAVNNGYIVFNWPK